MSETSGPVIVGLGEALFDVFPDRTVLGGAPLNVAACAHQLAATVGGAGIAASRVGVDELGDQVIEELRQRGMTADYIQRGEAPTGQVLVTFDANEPQYDIVRNVAWDELEWTQTWEELARRCDAVCFGTLAQRSEQSRNTIYRFLHIAEHAHRLFDVNLRQQWFDADVLQRSCEAASAVKLNTDEVATVCELLQIDGIDPIERLRELLRRFQLQAAILTRGADGTLLITAEAAIEGEQAAFPTDANADSVGAGDACSAGILYGLCRGWDVGRTVSLANVCGAFVASQPGATPVLPPEILSRCR